MSKPAAKQGDRVVGVDTHVVMIPSPGGPVPTPTPMPFDGLIDGNLSADVQIEHQPAATKGSTARSTPHVPTGGTFQKPPTNKATIQTGSGSVMINHQPLAQMDSEALTCNDPSDAPNGIVIASGTTVLAGD